MEKLLLDTCAAIWIMENAPFDAGAAARVNKAAGSSNLFVSAFTAWEMAMLCAKGRIRLAMLVDDWFEALLRTPGLALADLPPRVLIASAQLPGAPPNDPADRIIIATARAFNMNIVTRDEKILAYGREGHARVLPC